MIFEGHQIGYSNVASKIYRFFPEEIDVAIKDFDQILTKNGYHPDGRLFFSIISDPTEEIMIAELFIPIEERYFHNKSDEEIQFSSYFSVNNMVMTRIFDDFDNESQAQYWELIEYLKRNAMDKRTPMFIEYKSNQLGEVFVEMSIGFK